MGVVWRWHCLPEQRAAKLNPRETEIKDAA
jgi:hypothetical protein